MKIIWQDCDIISGRRYGKPGSNERWTIGYVCGAITTGQYVAVSDSGWMVTEPRTREEMVEMLNKEEYQPVELLLGSISTVTHNPKLNGEERNERNECRESPIERLVNWREIKEENFPEWKEFHSIVDSRKYGTVLLKVFFALHKKWMLRIELGGGSILSFELPSENEEDAKRDALITAYVS